MRNYYIDQLRNYIETFGLFHCHIALLKPFFGGCVFLSKVTWDSFFVSQLSTWLAKPRKSWQFDRKSLQHSVVV